ncbi:hypothetical protein BGZ50_002608 [Haplosporangium sp. Z 11]|nr:hypothetical protein BGZ50_002608 [Haplosporangium sp. Z 11]
MVGNMILMADFEKIVPGVVRLTKPPWSKTHFTSSRHATFGLIIICAFVLQVCIGVFIFHTFDSNHDPKEIHILTWMHRLWGYAVLTCGLAHVYFGMDAYGIWPGGKETVWILYYVWVAVLRAVFLGGSVMKLLVHRKDNKNGQGDGYNGGSDFEA